MSQARLLLSESWASIRQNLSTTVAATMTVLIGMCLLGLFIALGTWVLSWSGHLQDQLRVKVNFCTTVSMPECSANATPAQIRAVGAALRSDPDIKQVVFVSKEQGLKNFIRDNPREFAGALGLLNGNPLPDQWVVTTSAASDTPIVGKRICAAHYAGVEPCATAVSSSGGSSQLGEVGGVTWASSITKRVLTIGKVISLVFLIAVVLLVIASTLLIANTIRLSIFSRRREIEVMKLVGATNWFIRGPFMLEGLLCGLCGAVLAVILLLLGKTLVLPTVLGHVTTGTNDGVHAVAFSLNALVLIVAGLLLGALGSGLTIRRFLQV
jgi:cell division transport system permease protein